jgi:hypothetical protein
VLDLDAAKAVELLLVTVGDKAKGIEESKRSLGTELVFEGHVGGNRSTGGVLGRGEGGGTGDEGSDDDRFHIRIVVRMFESEDCEKIARCANYRNDLRIAIISS